MLAMSQMEVSQANQGLGLVPPAYSAAENTWPYRMGNLIHMYAT